MLTLGNKNELFIDDFLISQSCNVNLGLTSPVRQECVYKINTELEGMTCGYFSIVESPETDQIYMYYRTDFGTALAVSRDGKKFEPVNDEIYHFDNGLKHIVFHGKPPCHNFAPFYDENPNCPKEQKFKAIGLNGWPNAKLLAFCSEDGKNWVPLVEEPIISDGMFDSLNTAMWNKNAKKYRCFSRYFKQSEEQKEAQSKAEIKGDFEAVPGTRAIQICESDDFINWTKPEPFLYNGIEAPHQFYTNAIRAVPEAEHILVGFPMRFCEGRKKVAEHCEDGVTDAVFISSRDSINWNYNGKAWLYPENDLRQWTERNNMVSAGFIERDNEYSIYLYQHYHWDDAQIVRYTIPKFRFGYVYSEYGHFTTKSFVLDGERLTFNYNTSAIGSLKVTVLDETGNALDGYSYEIFGNEFDYAINLKELKGKVLRLKIELEDAFLYSIGY